MTTNKTNGNGSKATSKANEPNWYDVFNARITKQNLGSLPTADMYRAAITLGPQGKGKRPGVEALWVAMTLRPEGSTINQYETAGQCRTANNWLQYLNDEGKRHVYSQVHVTNVGGTRFTRLTAKGVAHCVQAGMAKGALERLTRPVDAAKVKATAKVTTAKPVPTPAPAKAKGASKPKGKPIQAPAPKPATPPAKAPDQAPRQVLTTEGPKPLPQPTAQQGDGSK